MTRFALYNPKLDQYISYLQYNRKTKCYDIEYTRNFYAIWFWHIRSSAEEQAQRVVDWNRGLVLEVHEIN